MDVAANQDTGSPDYGEQGLYSQPRHRPIALDRRRRSRWPHKVLGSIHRPFDVPNGTPHCILGPLRRLQAEAKGDISKSLTFVVREAQKLFQRLPAGRAWRPFRCFQCLTGQVCLRGRGRCGGGGYRADRGPKRSWSVGPKSAITGRCRAAARCMGPLSLRNHQAGASRLVPAAASSGVRPSRLVKRSSGQSRHQAPGPVLPAPHNRAIGPLFLKQTRGEFVKIGPLLFFHPAVRKHDQRRDA